MRIRFYPKVFDGVRMGYTRITYDDDDNNNNNNNNNSPN
jgi:hypothetical protein